MSYFTRTQTHKRLAEPPCAVLFGSVGQNSAATHYTEQLARIPATSSLRTDVSTQPQRTSAKMFHSSRRRKANSKFVNYANNTPRQSVAPNCNANTALPSAVMAQWRAAYRAKFIFQGNSMSPAKLADSASVPKKNAVGIDQGTS